MPSSTHSIPHPPTIDDWLDGYQFTAERRLRLTGEILDKVNAAVLEQVGERMARTGELLRPYVVRNPDPTPTPQAAEYAAPNYTVRWTKGDKLRCRGCGTRLPRGNYAAINAYRAACLVESCIDEASR